MSSADGPLSPQNQRVTAARRLLRPRNREQERRFLAEGPQAVREALAAGAVLELFVDAEQTGRHAELLDAARTAGLRADVLPNSVLRSLSETVTPQGVVAVCAAVDVPVEEALCHSPSLVTLLVQARDPGNAGTVLRASDAAGAGAVVLTKGSVDVYNGKCVRACAGSLFHLPVVVGTTAEDAVHALHAAGLRVLAADAAGAADLDDLVDAGSLAVPTAWLFGNEAWGLPDEVAALADEVVRVPIHGRAESLNLAAAAAVCLYASARAQRGVRA